uniref:Uncharacterized protein n=1 Tax=Geospiza parvula TaxID=87175 RepID=A0A8U8BKM8_GEOPR
ALTALGTDSTAPGKRIGKPSRPSLLSRGFESPHHGVGAAGGRRPANPPPPRCVNPKRAWPFRQPVDAVKLGLPVFMGFFWFFGGVFLGFFLGGFFGVL